MDLASQLVLSVAERSMARYHPAFPIGRGKLEALAVIACACIMSIASLEVAQYAAVDLYNGIVKGGPQARRSWSGDSGVAGGGLSETLLPCMLVFRGARPAAVSVSPAPAVRQAASPPAPAPCPAQQASTPCWTWAP